MNFVSPKLLKIKTTIKKLFCLTVWNELKYSHLRNKFHKSHAHLSYHLLWYILKNTSRLDNLKCHFIHDSFFQIFDNPPFLTCLHATRIRSISAPSYHLHSNHQAYKKKTLRLKIMLILDLVFWNSRHGKMCTLNSKIWKVKMKQGWCTENTWNHCHII